MEKLRVERIHGRPISFFQLAEWVWEEPSGPGQFTLLVAASASRDEVELIGRFAANAVACGCGYVCAWGEGSERVHDLFDEATIAADRLVMTTWHEKESLPEALYFALVNAIPEDVVPAQSPVILAVQEPWVMEVRRLVADQDELARLWVSEGR